MFGKLVAQLVLCVASFGVNVAGAVYGYGLHIENWGYLITAGVANLIILAGVMSIASE